MSSYCVLLNRSNQYFGMEVWLFGKQSNIYAKVLIVISCKGHFWIGQFAIILITVRYYQFWARATIAPHSSAIVIPASKR